MPACSKVLCARILLAALAIVPVAEARAATRITVTFDDVLKQASPVNRDYRIQNTRKYTLEKNINMSTTSSFNHDTSGGLGKSGTGTDVNGVTYAWTFRIVNGALVIVNDYPGFVSITRIRTNGKTSCSVTRDYNSKHGEFVISNANHQNRTYSDFHTENLTCAIEQIPD